MFWENVAAGVVANALFVGLTLGIGLLILTARRRALLRFWGLARVRKLRIYVSHLRIQVGGALDASGAPRSYQGSVVTQLETEMANLIRNLFVAEVPGRAVQPTWTERLLFVSADVEIHPAPLESRDIDQEGSVIALGSPGYNVVSGVIETDCGSRVCFATNNVGIKLPGNLAIRSPQQSVLVRLPPGGRYWFYAAGLSEEGTAAAAYYLAKNWRRLDRVYRTSPSFFVVTEFSGNDFRNARIVAEAAM